MGERSTELKQHIDATRGALDRDLKILGARMKPRAIYRRHTRAVIGTAIVGGLLALWLAWSATRRRSGVAAT